MPVTKLCPSLLSLDVIKPRPNADLTAKYLYILTTGGSQKKKLEAGTEAKDHEHGSLVCSPYVLE